MKVLNERTPVNWYSILRSVIMVVVIAVAYLAPSLVSPEWYASIGIELPVAQQVAAALGFGVVSVLRAAFPDAFEPKG